MTRTLLARLPAPLRLPRLILLALSCAAFLLSGTNAGAQSRIIVIDPGHGGHDRGGVPGQRVSEKMMTLDVSLRLKKILEASGYRVIMTRTNDVFIPLGTRTGIANSYRGSTFVSVHFNSAQRSGANGIETYYFRGDSAGLAASIHRNVMAIAPTENRGIRRRGFFVLRNTSVPGVLVECGFLTNPSEASLALNANYRQRLAEAIARGIRRQPAGPNRPLNRESAASVDVLPQQMLGPDFVRAVARPPRTRGRVTHYRSKRGASAREKRGSSRARSKGSSSGSKKKSSSSKKRKRSSSTIIAVDWRVC